MRLYNTYYICKSLLDKVDCVQFSSNAANTAYYFNNWKNYKEALMALRKIPFFKEEIDEIYDTIPVFAREKEQPVIDSSIMSRFNEKNRVLCNRIRTIIELYDSMNLCEGNKNGVDIKIPQCNELKDYIWYLREIDFVLTQCPYLLSKDEKLEFNSVDVGSSWLTFVLTVSAGASATFYILNNLAKLLDKALILKSHYTSIKEQEEALKVAQKKTELAESEQEIFETLKKHYMNQAVEELKEESGNLKDGEEVGKVEKSLDKLVNLLDKGVEIYASLDSPKDVQILFPALDEGNCLPENILQLIEDKKQTEE